MVDIASQEDIADETTSADGYKSKKFLHKQHNTHFTEEVAESKKTHVHRSERVRMPKKQCLKKASRLRGKRQMELKTLSYIRTLNPLLNVIEKVTYHPSVI